MATIPGKFINDSGVTELEGSLETDGAIPASDLTLTVRNAAGVPAGAPTGTELPVAADTTAVTGGWYFWTGAAWVKIADIP